ncbi:MAG: LCP family protein [Spirochaetota bacterium]
MKRKRKLDKGFVLIALIIIIILVTSVTLFIQLRTDPISEALIEGTPLQIVFFITEAEKLLFSEVFFYNPATSKGAILDMPGDLGSIIEPIKRIDRIDILYKRGKVQPFKRKIEELTNVSIPYYVQIEVEKVEALVDLVEGLDVFIANPVEIVNADHIILLPSGSILLDGSKVKTYITYTENENESDIEKINRKQKFIQAFLKKMGESYSTLSNEKVYPFLASYIHTNLDKRALLAFIKEMAKLDAERIIFQRVLGVKRIVDNQELLFPHYDGKLLQETIKQTLETLASKEAAGDEDLAITLEILNGTPVNGLASRTAQLFQSFGLEVLSVKNAEHSNYDYTMVLDRTGDLTKAQKVASIINCTRVSTIPEPVTSDENTAEAENNPVPPKVDVTVILGKDFDGRYCK